MTENNNNIDEQTLEKHRRLEYGDHYEYWFRRCNNCKKITYYGSFYFQLIYCTE